jgi:hypothetical protein
MKKIANCISRFWMNNSSLILRLILPLVILSAILIRISAPVALKDIALNLATDLITIVVTVLYVDWVIRQHDRVKWSVAKKYIANEAAGIANSFIRDVSEALKIDDEIFPRPSSLDVREIQSAILERVACLDRFAIEDALAKLSKDRWRELISIVDARRAASTPIISQFAARLDADQLSSILSFRHICSSIAGTYRIFNDFLGVPVPKLPEVKGGRPEEYSVLTIIRLGIDFRAAFDASLEIIRTFDFVIEPAPDNMEETEASWARWYERTSP